MSVISRRWRKIKRRYATIGSGSGCVAGRRCARGGHSCYSWGDSAGRRCCQSGSRCHPGAGGHCRARCSPSPAVNARCAGNSASCRRSGSGYSSNLSARRDRERCGPDRERRTAAQHRRVASSAPLQSAEHVPTIRICPHIVFSTRSVGLAATGSYDSINFAGDEAEAPGEGWEIVPSYDAKCLVAYLMSRDQSHPLKEAKSPVTLALRPGQGGAKMSDQIPENPPRQGMDYGETEEVQDTHAAIYREKVEPRIGREPLSLWLIAIYGLAVFFGGAYLGRYAGDFSGNGLDYLGGAPGVATKGSGNAEPSRPPN